MLVNFWKFHIDYGLKIQRNQINSSIFASMFLYNSSKPSFRNKAIINIAKMPEFIQTVSMWKITSNHHFLLWGGDGESFKLRMIQILSVIVKEALKNPQNEIF